MQRGKKKGCFAVERLERFTTFYVLKCNNTHLQQSSAMTAINSIFIVGGSIPHFCLSSSIPFCSFVKRSYSSSYSVVFREAVFLQQKLLIYRRRFETASIDLVHKSGRERVAVSKRSNGWACDRGNDRPGCFPKWKTWPHLLPGLLVNWF